MAIFYECPLCRAKGFKTLYDIQRHAREQHGRIVEPVSYTSEVRGKNKRNNYTYSTKEACLKKSKVKNEDIVGLTDRQVLFAAYEESLRMFERARENVIKCRVALDRVVVDEETLTLEQTINTLVTRTIDQFSRLERASLSKLLARVEYLIIERAFSIKHSEVKVAAWLGMARNTVREKRKRGRLLSEKN